MIIIIIMMMMMMMMMMMSRRLRPGVVSHNIIFSNYTHVYRACIMREKKVKMRCRCHQMVVQLRML